MLTTNIISGDKNKYIKPIDLEIRELEMHKCAPAALCDHTNMPMFMLHSGTVGRMGRMRKMTVTDLEVHAFTC